MRKFVIITIVFKILISNIRLYIEYIKEEVRYMDMKKLSKVISIVLIVMILILNLLAKFISKKFNKANY